MIRWRAPRGEALFCVNFTSLCRPVDWSRTDCQEFTNGLPTFFRTEKAHTRELLRCLLKKIFPLPAHKDWEVMGSSLGKLAICNRPPRANLLDWQSVLFPANATTCHSLRELLNRVVNPRNALAICSRE